MSHVTVEDHYCYLHYREHGSARKTALGLPLAELMEQLPAGFMQVHRSSA